MNKNKIIILGSGSSMGVPRIDGYWGRVDKKNLKNNRTRCSIYIKHNNLNILIDTSPDIRAQLLKNKIKKINNIIYTEKRLKKINSKIKIKKFCTKIDSNNISKIAKEYDLIIDGTDSFRSKLLINDYCAKNKKILITGAISKFDGHVFVFNFQNKKSPCLRCFMPEAPETDMLDCQSEGVIATLAGMIGSIMANEAIREVLNFKNSLCGNILMINAENLSIKKIKLNKNKNCINS